MHGIGGPRDAADELGKWLRSLATGVRAAGHPQLVSGLTMGWAAESRFADYSDLYLPRQAQGGQDGELYDEEAAIVAELLAEMVDSRLPDADELLRRRLLAIREQLHPTGQEQGPGHHVRRLGYLCTSLLSLPGLQQAAQWASGRRLLAAVSQVGRYLGRRTAPGDDRPLDVLARERVLAQLDPDRPSVIVAHSLGTVVALEALQEYPGPVPLFVTLGSPIATPALVLPRLRPQPVRTPECVEQWLDFWHRDDIVVPKRPIDTCVAANTAGVQPRSRPVHSDGLWVHNATTYLAQREVADGIVTAVTAAVTRV
ncbi:alpha/beta fold hydrolase [Kitasatospora sp. NE20-6]|uniref:alpha/beta fold hydrolase n=1 Tax=Kitasatospora sp. NE20-6 TaxID=2859066 RepID=UPI0038B27A8F